MKRALFIGRFQPFHLGHLEDIKNMLKEVDELVIGVGSSNEKHTKKNPFTAEERIEMINLVLPNNNISSYTVFPIPDFHNDEKWVEHIETLVPKFNVVYTGNKWTERCFKNKGYKVRKVNILKGISSTKIRNNILKDKEWKTMVPKEIANFLEKINAKKRLKK
ncbi:nicotinamide-nucleotide adenylyltransferase [Candidatus Woesearchaeota archaeon]|nr:nicotinamide-nucleotide adenylyltransferase [Candidatus Woesearchaeota archaeon]